jgi:hypothetical protein
MGQKSILDVMPEGFNQAGIQSKKMDSRLRTEGMTPFNAAILDFKAILQLVF